MFARIARFVVAVWSLVVGFFSWSLSLLRGIGWSRVWSGVRRIDWRPWLMMLPFVPLYWVHRGDFISATPPITIWGWVVRLFLSLMIVGFSVYLAIKFARLRRGSHPLEWAVAIPTVLLLLFIWGGLSFAPAPIFTDLTLVSPVTPSLVEEGTPSLAPVTTPGPTRVVGLTSRPTIAGRTLSDLDLYVVTRGDAGSAFALVSLLFAEWGSDHALTKAELLSLIRWIESEDGREIREEFATREAEVQIRKSELLAKNGIEGVASDGSLIPMHEEDAPTLAKHLRNLGF